MVAVKNMYRAKRGKGAKKNKDGPSAHMRRTHINAKRVGVRSIALAVSEIKGAA